MGPSVSYLSVPTSTSLDYHIRSLWLRMVYTFREASGRANVIAILHNKGPLFVCMLLVLICCFWDFARVESPFLDSV